MWTQAAVITGPSLLVRAELGNRDAPAYADTINVACEKDQQGGEGGMGGRKEDFVSSCFANLLVKFVAPVPGAGQPTVDTGTLNHDYSQLSC